jgi:N-acetylglucosaminyl-diphospho-decaprenol L-rhamnosyltransferase
LPALIVSYTSHPGGAERILADHATAIGDDAIAACPEGWLADRLRESGIRVFPLKERGLELRGQRPAAAVRLAAHGREVRELVEALRPHTVVAWGMRAALAYAALLPRFAEPNPRFVFQHNDLLPSLTVARAVRAAAKRADLVLALSEAIAIDLAVEGTEVIHPGVDLGRFSPAPGARSGALWLGALTPWKRPDLAIKAASEAGISLTIAGGPLDPAGEELERRLRSSAGPGVTFAGRLPDPAEALGQAAVLLHTADREPYGMSLVEALASGLPVVAAAAGGPKEIVDDTCGRLFRPGDPHAAAAALKAALDNREALGAAARARAESHFDLAESRRRYARTAELTERPADSHGIAVVTVLHNSGEDLRALMASLERHLPDARLIAVDSGSGDDGPEAAREWGATVIDAGGNVGYGRGTNIGVKAATEPVTLVLNPDIELLDDSLAKLAAEAARHPDRILAPVVLLPDGRRQDSVHPPPGTATEVVRAVAPVPIEPWRANSSRRVGWAVGCALAVSTATLRRLGPFDESAFLYGEDLDLGLRAAHAGVETWFWPYARVLHKRAHSTTEAFGGEPFDLLAQRRRTVIEERTGAGARDRDDLIQAATFANRIALKTILGKSSIREKSQLRALLRARRGPPAR